MHDPKNSSACKLVIESARKQKLLLNDAQMNTAVDATEHLLREMNTDTLSAYIMGLIVKAAVKVVDESK